MPCLTNWRQSDGHEFIYTFRFYKHFKDLTAQEKKQFKNKLKNSKDRRYVIGGVPLFSAETAIGCRWKKIYLHILHQYAIIALTL